MEIKKQDFVAEPTGAIKADGSKHPIELIDPEFILGLSQVLKYGAEKYVEHNWAKGFKWSRLIGSSMRHLLAFASGEDVDPETGLSHLYHLGCNAMFLAYHQKYKKDLDDRFFANKPEAAALPQESDDNKDASEDDSLPKYLTPPTAQDSRRHTVFRLPNYPDAYVVGKYIPDYGIKIFVVLPLSWLADYPKDEIMKFCGEPVGWHWGYALAKIDKEFIFGSEIKISQDDYKFRQFNVTEHDYTKVFVSTEQDLRKLRAAVVIANR